MLYLVSCISYPLMSFQMCMLCVDCRTVYTTLMCQTNGMITAVTVRLVGSDAATRHIPKKALWYSKVYTYMTC